MVNAFCDVQVDVFHLRLKRYLYDWVPSVRNIRRRSGEYEEIDAQVEQRPQEFVLDLIIGFVEPVNDNENL